MFQSAVSYNSIQNKKIKMVHVCERERAGERMYEWEKDAPQNASISYLKGRRFQRQEGEC